MSIGYHSNIFWNRTHVTIGTFCPSMVPEYAKSFFIIASVYEGNMEASIHDLCIGNTIMGSSFTSLLVDCLTGSSLPNIPTALYN